MHEPNASDPAHVDWPALVQYAGEAELTFVRDADEWRLDPDLRKRKFGPADRLIDSDGRVYAFAGARPTRLVATDGRLTLAEVQPIVQAHLRKRRVPAELMVAYLEGYPPPQRLRVLVHYVGRHEHREGSDDDGD